MTQLSIEFSALETGGAMPVTLARRDVDAVREVMRCGRWMTPEEVSDASGVSVLSVTARMRDLRKPQYGAHQVKKRVRAGSRRLMEYRLVVPWGTC